MIIISFAALSQLPMKIINYILKSVSWLGFIIIFLLAAYLLVSNLGIYGEYRTFSVRSGSMEPAISTGDIIIVKKEEGYQVNDIITFVNEEDRIITHRIIKDNVQNENYITQGDANATSDEDEVSDRQIVGRVQAVIPRLGFLVAFGQTKAGFIALLLIPVTLFVLDELLKLKDKHD